MTESIFKTGFADTCPISPAFQPGAGSNPLDRSQRLSAPAETITLDAPSPNRFAAGSSPRKLIVTSAPRIPAGCKTGLGQSYRQPAVGDVMSRA